MEKTNQYYDTNSEDFIQSTLYLDMTNLYQKFEIHLKNGDRILDIGCGPGRDLKYFASKYEAYGIEPSQKFSVHAKTYSKVSVFEGDFDSYKSDLKFNGIWACASLLHIPSSKLNTTFKKINELLIEGGVLYASFKYGEFEGERNGRFFVDLTEIKLAELISNTKLSIHEFWITEDLRPGRNAEKWLNAILKVS